jgi:hypothetical protein
MPNDVISVQYYILLTYNIPRAHGRQLNPHGGEHEGDWICLDYGVVVRNGLPRIVHAIYHNHG